MRFARVPYAALNSRQKENFNFHKIAARLADYGYTSMRLSDDFHGADFIALHVDGETMLRVQLKGRFVLDGKYEGRGLHVAFRDGARTYLYPHDETLAAVLALGHLAGTSSWDEGRAYSWPSPPAWARELLEPHGI